jgi:HEAT repeat protein
MIILVVLVVGGIIWWLSSSQAASRNEKTYLRTRGYDPADPPEVRSAARQEARLMDLLNSLDDVTPYSRERAAEELSLLCESGEQDERMFAPLVAALDDRNSSVRGAAAMALGNLRDARAVSHLERVLGSDGSSHARNQARLALQKLEAVAASDAPAPLDNADQQSKTAD